MVMRQCQKCGELKPLSEFSMEPRIISKRKWKCKACEAEDLRAWVKKTRASYEQHA